MIQYVRIKFHAAGSKPKWYWAIKKKDGVFFQCKKDGDEWFGKGNEQRLMIGKPLIEKPAHMNKHYAWLEVVE